MYENEHPKKDYSDYAEPAPEDPRLVAVRRFVDIERTRDMLRRDLDHLRKKADAIEEEYLAARAEVAHLLDLSVGRESKAASDVIPEHVEARLMGRA